MSRNRIYKLIQIVLCTVFIYSCGEQTPKHVPFVVRPSADSKLSVTTKLFTALERRTRDAMLGMNLVSSIHWEIYIKESEQTHTKGYFKLNSIRASIEITSPSRSNFEINTSDTSKINYSINSKPYATLLNKEVPFEIRDNLVQLSDSSYFNLAEQLPSAHKDDLVSEQFFLLVRDQAIQNYLEHLFIWELPDTSVGTTIEQDFRIFQGLTLNVHDSLKVDVRNKERLYLSGKGGVEAWYGLNGVDGILSKKNRASGTSDIHAELNLITQFPEFINIHLRAEGKALNYETMYPFKLEADIKHSIKILP